MVQFGNNHCILFNNNDSVWHINHCILFNDNGSVWHINHCRLFSAKSSLYIYIKHKITHFVDNIFKEPEITF